MALQWSWAWGAESTAELADMGFQITDTYWVSDSSAARVYSYSGSAPRYSLITNNNSLGDASAIDPPAAALNPPAGALTSGWVTIACKRDGSSTLATPESPVFSWVRGMIGVRSTSSAGRYAISLRPVGQVIQLYVADVFVGSSAAYDWGDFHYVALKYDYSANPWSGELYIDGNLEASGTSARAAETVPPVISMHNCGTTAAPYCLAQIIIYTSSTPTVTASQPYFVTRISPDEDVAGSGTWNPAANPGAPVQAPNLASPYNTATTVADATPVTGDKIIVATDGNAGTNLNTRLGTTVTAPASGAPSIGGVTCHTWSIGDGVTNVKAGIENATGTTYGIALTADATASTYTIASSDTQPGGANWLGTTASPDLVYEVD